MEKSGRTLIFSLNPSVDVEWKVPQVVWEEKNNILSERRWAGGKGVNVARWFRLLGGNGLLVLPLGGTTGQEMRTFLEGEKLPFHAIPIAETTRANIIVTTEQRRQLRFNPLGPELSSQDWNAIYDLLKEDYSTVIFSGALTRKAPPETYRTLLELCARKGSVQTILDCDGEAFAQGVKGKPFLVKPNASELAQWAGRPLARPEEVVQAARELAQETTGHVLVSLGAEGALMVWNTGAGDPRIFRAHTPQVTVLNTVGAGDSLLAGVAFGLSTGKQAEDCLRMAIATSSLAVSKPAGVLPTREEVQQFFSKIEVYEV